MGSPSPAFSTFNISKALFRRDKTTTNSVHVRATATIARSRYAQTNLSFCRFRNALQLVTPIPALQANSDPTPATFRNVPVLERYIISVFLLSHSHYVHHSCNSSRTLPVLVTGHVHTPEYRAPCSKYGAVYNNTPQPFPSSEHHPGI